MRELLDDALVPLGDAALTPVEPGHAFEWVALAARRARLGAGAPPAWVAGLYETALGALDARGFAPMSALPSGAPVDASRRTWAQAEALRAHLARAEAGDRAAAARAHALFDAIVEAHLDPAPLGGWIDRFDAGGAPCVDAITAATGYHLVTAFAEASAHPAMRTAARSAPS